MSEIVAVTNPDQAPDLFACRACGRELDMDTRFCPVCGTMALADAPDPLIGQIVAGRYRIVQLLGRGGMGVVYKCEHTLIGKVMAIKLLHGELAREADVRRRFRIEARAVSQLSCPSTVGIFDFGTDDGLMYLVMEYIQGEDLGRILRNGSSIPMLRAARIALQASASLAEAHEKGIIHRDLKPENLLIARGRGDRDLVKLLDFGLARLRDGDDRGEITNHGVLLGTPYYMAPETIEGKTGDHRVDIYALGAVIYRAITGVVPFSGSSPIAVLTKALTERLISPSERRPDLEIPPAIDDLVMRCMAKDPGARFRDAESVRVILEDLVGENETGLTPSGLSHSISRPHTSIIGPGKDGLPAVQLEVATRDDVEEFERRLRRGRIAGWSSLLVLLVALGGTGGWLWNRYRLSQSLPKDYEVEDNSKFSNATIIAPETDIRGRLGARISESTGDIDRFQLTNSTGQSRLIDIDFKPPPNIDAVLDVSASGAGAAVFSVNDQPEGSVEIARGYRLEGSTQYFVSIHEAARPAGRLPTENVSDDYVLRYALRPIAPGDEIEPDGNEQSANKLVETAGTVATGYITHSLDQDWWCFDTLSHPVKVSLAPPGGSDLALGIYAVGESINEVVDQKRTGETETTLVRPTTIGRPPCIIVKAPTGLRFNISDATVNYKLSIEAP